MTKKPDSPGPLEPTVSLVGGLKASGRTLLAKTPILGTIVHWAESLESQRRTERLGVWAEYIRGEDDEEGFAKKLQAGFESTDAEHVRAAILESTRAAVDALDPIIVPAIAKLTNRFLTKKTPEHRTYRDLLSLLRSLDGDEYRALASVMSIIAKASQDLGGALIDTTCTSLTLHPECEWVWRVSVADHGPRKGTPYVAELLRGELAFRVVGALLRAPGQLFNGRQSSSVSALIGGQPTVMRSIATAESALHLPSSPSFPVDIVDVLLAALI